MIVVIKNVLLFSLDIMIIDMVVINVWMNFKLVWVVGFFLLV